MIRFRIAWASLLLAGLTGCSAAQHRLQPGTSIPTAGSSDPFDGPPAAQASTGMSRFFPSLASHDPAAKTAAKPASKPPSARTLAKSSADPTLTQPEKKTFAPFARIEARWAERVKNAKAAAEAKVAMSARAKAPAPSPAATPSPTTASLRRRSEPSTLPQSLSVAIFPDDSTATPRDPSARQTATPPETPEPPAIDPGSAASTGARDDETRRTQAEVAASVSAETSPAPEPETCAVLDAHPSPFAAPEPPHLPPTEAELLQASLRGRPRLAVVDVFHRPRAPVASPTPEQPKKPKHEPPVDRTRDAAIPASYKIPSAVKLPPLGLPPDLPPPMFLRSYYGLDPVPSAAAPAPRQAARIEEEPTSLMDRLGQFWEHLTAER